MVLDGCLEGVCKKSHGNVDKIISKLEEEDIYGK
jgi:hypothetical protein